MVMPPKRQRSNDPIVIDGSTRISDTVLEKNVSRATAMLLAIVNLPLFIVTDPAFRDFMNCTRALRSSYVMSRPSVRVETLNTHAEIRQSLYNRLSMANTYIPH